MYFFLNLTLTTRNFQLYINAHTYKLTYIFEIIFSINLTNLTCGKIKIFGVTKQCYYLEFLYKYNYRQYLSKNREIKL